MSKMYAVFAVIALSVLGSSLALAQQEPQEPRSAPTVSPDSPVGNVGA